MRFLQVLQPVLVLVCFWIECRAGVALRGAARVTEDCLIARLDDSCETCDDGDPAIYMTPLQEMSIDLDHGVRLARLRGTKAWCEVGSVRDLQRMATQGGEESEYSLNGLLYGDREARMLASP